MFCTKCGRQLPESAVFCTGCGTHMLSTPAQPSQNTAPAQAFNVPQQQAYVPYSPYAIPPVTKKAGKRLAIGLGVGIPIVALIFVSVFLLGPMLLTKKTSAVIDATGGAVQVEDMQLTFGKGVVQEPLNVALTSLHPSDDKKPDGLLSALYVMDTDSSFDKSVTVRVKLPDGQAGEGMMIGVGAEGMGEDGKTTVVNYRYIDAKIADGYAEAEIVPSEFATEAQAALAKPVFSDVVYAAGKNFRVYVGIFQCVAYFKEGGYFKLYYPGAAQIASAESLMTDLESAYQAFLDAGYNYDKRTVWPMEVHIIKMNDLGGYVESGSWNNVTGRSPNNGWIEINKSMFLGGYQRDALKPILGHEWFHFVQANYEANSSNLVQGTNETNAIASPWFDDATATYYEGKIRRSMPDIVNEYQMMIFDGVFPPADTAQAGYARAPEISFLVDRFGGNFMLKTYQGFAKGTPSRDAIIAATADPAEWAGDCYEYIVSGKTGNMKPFNVYPNITSGDAEFSKIGATMDLKYPSQEDINQAAADGEPVVLSEGSVTIPALGARFLAVTVDDSLKMNLSDGDVLQFKTASGVDMRLFSIISLNYTVAKASDYEIDIADFKGDLNKKTVYLLMLTNTSASDPITASVSAEIQSSLSLDEIVGTYADGNVTMANVQVEASVYDDLNRWLPQLDTTSEMYATAAFYLKYFQELQAKNGSSVGTAFEITKTGPLSGEIVINEDHLPFTYDKGVLTLAGQTKNANNTIVNNYSGTFSVARTNIGSISLSGQFTDSIDPVNSISIFWDIVHSKVSYSEKITGSKPAKSTP